MKGSKRETICANVGAASDKIPWARIETIRSAIKGEYICNTQRGGMARISACGLMVEDKEREAHFRCKAFLAASSWACAFSVRRRALTSPSGALALDLDHACMDRDSCVSVPTFRFGKAGQAANRPGPCMHAVPTDAARWHTLAKLAS